MWKENFESGVELNKLFTFVEEKNLENNFKDAKKIKVL